MWKEDSFSEAKIDACKEITIHGKLKHALIIMRMLIRDAH